MDARLKRLVARCRAVLSEMETHRHETAEREFPYEGYGFICDIFERAITEAEGQVPSPMTSPELLDESRLYGRQSWTQS